MFLLNLTGPEFFALLAALGGVISALYLLDRAKGRKVVSTLQFWVQAGASDQRQPRRRVREPWSLILQLLSLLLLLLAAARFEWGSRSGRGRDHVVLIDTSSWAAGRSRDQKGTVLASEQEQVRRYLLGLPASDRVMLVSAASVAEPLTRFSADRGELRRALAGVRAGYSALDVDAVSAFAVQARKLSAGVPGEIVYTGPQLAEREPAARWRPDRILPVNADRDDCGILQFTAEPRENEGANSWQALVRLKNYGSRSRTLRLRLKFGNTNFAPRSLVLAPGGEANEEYSFSTQTAGELTARIDPGDSLATDDSASLTLPRNDFSQVTVYTERPQLLRPLIASDRQLQATFLPASPYRPQNSSDLVIVDSLDLPVKEAVPILWINPPSEHSPLPVKGSVRDAVVTAGPAGSTEFALHAKPIRVPAANCFQVFEGDEALARAGDCPVVVVRGAVGHPRSAIIGFDPLAPSLRFGVETPLLFARLMDELSPAAFRERAFAAERVGLTRVSLNRGEQSGSLRVRDDRGQNLPFTRRASELQFFTLEPATVHVTSDRKERILSLQLPAVGDRAWGAADVVQGLPQTAVAESAAVDLWKWLAGAAATLLLLEWFLFGRGARGRIRRARTRATSESRAERELALK